MVKKIKKLPPIQNGNNSSSVLGNCLKGRLRHVKVRSRGITPTTIVIRECKVWWTKICGSNSDGSASETPLRNLPCVTNYLIATTTWLTIIKQSSTQCCWFYTISICVQISIATCTTYKLMKIKLWTICTIWIFYGLLLKLWHF